MENDYQDPEFARKVAERKSKDENLLVIFCVIFAMIFSFYTDKHPAYSAIIEFFKVVGSTLAILIPSIIATLLIIYLTKLKWHYAFAISVIVVAFLIFLGSKN